MRTPPPPPPPKAVSSGVSAPGKQSWGGVQALVKREALFTRGSITVGARDDSVSQSDLAKDKKG